MRPGERVLLAGPSGSGKSTLLRALAGLLGTAEAGELTGAVTLDGAPAGSRPGAGGLVLQEPGSGLVAATVGRDVAFGLENVGAPRESMPPAVAEALAAVGLGDLPLDTPTSALSGGQTQRLALAGALALDPTLLLLDEPTAMLDPGCAAEVREAVRRVSARGGRTLVVVEHVLGPWVDLVERLVVLGRDGSLVADGPVHEVLAAERERLLDLGVWVPGARPPDPVEVPAGLLAVRSAAGGHDARPLAADPFTVVRTTRLLDGTARTARAAELAAPLEAAPGTFTALVGPSGSGKSTLLHALAGFLTPDPPGAVRVGGAGGPVAPDRLAAADLARALAWVPQWASSTIVADTVLDEALATSRALGTADEDTSVRARAVLDVLGLAHLERADPRRLSGGEQRRLGVAAALLHGPPVLLADEPTVGQDRGTWAAVVGLVAAHRRAGGAVVAATHDAEVVARAHRVHTVVAPARPRAAAAVRAPLVSRCGPLALLVGALLGVPAGVLSPHWRTSLAVLAVQVLLTVVALHAPGPGPAPRGRVRGVLVRMLPGLLAALSVGWSTWWLAGRDLDAALTVALRVLVIVLPSAVLVPRIDPDRLGDHLAQRLGLPDRPVVATAAALQRVHTLGAVRVEISRARRVRGIELSLRRPAGLAAHAGALTMGLLVRTLRAAAELAVAMDARGFASAHRRSWWAAAPWRGADGLLVLLAALPVVTAVLVRTGA